MRHRKTSWIAALGIGLGLMLPLQIAAAEDNSFRDLTAEWWQWALSIPTPMNPTLDATGVRCGLGQRGDIWFLAGTFGGGPAVRGCSVPEGKEIFFPVANFVFFDSPNVCGQGPEHVSVKDMRAAIAAAIDAVSDLSVEVDGERVQRVQRVRSRVFAVALPENNLLDAACASAGGQPGGIYSPAVDDGYYVKLKPLPVGKHTLHFHAENTDAGFVLDTTYHLTVVPVSPAARRGH